MILTEIRGLVRKAAGAQLTEAERTSIERKISELSQDLVSVSGSTPYEPAQGLQATNPPLQPEDFVEFTADRIGQMHEIALSAQANIEPGSVLTRLA